MSLEKAETHLGEVEAVKGVGFHAGINNGQVTLSIEVGDGEFYFVQADAVIAHDIAATINELADELEAHND